MPGFSAGVALTHPLVQRNPAVMTCDFLSLAAPGVCILQPYQLGKPESELRREYGLTDIV